MALIKINVVLRSFFFGNCLIFSVFILFSLVISGNSYATDVVDNKDQNIIERRVENLSQDSTQKEFSPEEVVQKSEMNKKTSQPKSLPANDLPQKEVLPELRRILSKSQGATLEAVPFLRRLSQEFDVFKNDIISLATDPSEEIPIRIHMLEMLKEHSTDKDSTMGILRAFREGGPSSMVTAYAAKYLSEQGIDIGDEIINRFGNTDTAVKPFYLRSMGYLKKNDAVILIRDELDQSVDFYSRLAAIEALGRLVDIDHRSSNKLMRIARYRGRLIDGKRPAIRLEIEAQRAVFSIGMIGDVNINNLLELADDEDLTTNVRIAAVQSLKKYVKNANVDIVQSLRSIEKKFSLSNSSKSDKIRFKQMVYIVINVE